MEVSQHGPEDESSSTYFVVFPVGSPTARKEPSVAPLGGGVVVIVAACDPLGERITSPRAALRLGSLDADVCESPGEDTHTSITSPATTGGS